MTTGAPTSELATALAAIHAEAFDSPWSVEAFAVLLSQPGVILQGGADGFVLVRIVAGEAEILTLAVRPGVRRTGVATRLLEQATAQVVALGGDRLFLEVAEDNAAARALYRRLGFESVGRRPRYYARADGPEIDALLLARNLPAPLPSA